MPKVKIDDFEIYYEIHGKGEPVFLAPGLGALDPIGARMWPNLENISKLLYTITEAQARVLILKSVIQ